MKSINLKLIAAFMLLSFIGKNTFSQDIVKTIRESGTKQAKLDKNKIPKKVIDVFFKEYPMTVDGDWYGYPAFDMESYWYDYDPKLYTKEYPENYAVEFKVNNIPYTSIYTKTGKKISTLRMLHAALPKTVSDAIREGKYNTWKLLNDKEEIFKDLESDKLKVYKVEVEKGNEKHYLFFQSDGKLLKVKKVT